VVQAGGVEQAKQSLRGIPGTGPQQASVMHRKYKYMEVRGYAKVPRWQVGF